MVNYILDSQPTLTMHIHNCCNATESINSYKKLIINGINTETGLNRPILPRATVLNTLLFYIG